ncbi:MerR family transcriptional regulator [Variovorax sp. YR216]|uniref:MerR family transcriptional regulator n=1 Tax=Variovorax sp. YR216 TaxID=1882828 RepID=UPI00089AB78D|nr:MerR family transcriptional regulator [Variovorax sp. YR216]SEB22978.1 transcriptional regulator, MerR family [Variovorax sp. YR216]
MTDTKGSITVREAAERLGVTPRTLKYYEELGLVVPARSEGRYRLYEPGDIDKLARVLRLRSLGFSLTAITTMLQQPFEAPADGGRPRLSNASLKTLKATLAAQLETLDNRVEQVRRELKEAAAMQAQLRRDIDYVERRLNGESLEAILDERRREAPERKAALRKSMPS